MNATALTYLSAGAALATLQFCLVFLLEANLSSAWTSYAAVTVSWLAGSILALLIPSPLPRLRLAAGAGASYYLCLAILHHRPFQDPVLYIGAVTAALCGAYAGAFFRAAFAASGDVSRLFAWENDGFVLGLLACFWGLYAHSGFLLWTAPAAALALHALSARSKP
ncbi:MAG: hypothetical protein FD126_2678 [Elusimicrobia bacterium]|nr:MAG: hypothetical protein FD126_2678 [Elusimicrobiota bacterium]